MACVPCRRARQKCVPLGPSCFRCLERNLLCERQNQFTPQECCNTLFDSKATFNKHRKHLPTLLLTSAIVDAICAASQHSLETLLRVRSSTDSAKSISLESFTATPLSLDFSNPNERKHWFAIASFEAVMDICRASVNLSVDIQQSILDTWMANGSDLSRNLGQYQANFTAIANQTAPIVNKAMNIRANTLQEGLRVKLFWVLVHMAAIIPWDYCNLLTPNPGLSWQDMCPCFIEYVLCGFRNNTLFRFQVTSITIEYPNSSPRKGSVRGLIVNEVLYNKRPRNWFSAIVSITWLCSEGWYLHIFYYPTDCGIHVAFSSSPEFSWEKLNWRHGLQKARDSRIRRVSCVAGLDYGG
ncbi:hypothetical protein BCR33DRAFT_716651 [Rhizoclosmatium globosum]|uniref:Zn(2)-C6 fungal-type domain-containing protein n=1 Tax=Rhizoclosmatium globosum TaxID=329046 RepID=A0A1Y2CE82_9FUNG|nr:hypothetical protein BCR33DRAFT_716651 [Rhizoclosmatium globosum]|eukprot:ORY45371.1 hypothetical protein BCR33DRAFT_716651 [Rhizoclosmatium globosum]